MTSVSKRVAQAIEGDAVLREADARRLVNHRAVARWLIRTHAWDASEDAVLSCLRRLRNTTNRDAAFAAARDLLAQGPVNLRSQVCVITFAKTLAVQRALPAAFHGIDYARGDVLRIIQTTRAVKVVVDESNARGVTRAIGEARVESATLNITELNVVLPDASLETPGILALVSNALAIEGVYVVEVVSGLPEHLLFVADKDAMRAYEALMRLTKPPPRISLTRSTEDARASRSTRATPRRS